MQDKYPFKMMAIGVAIANPIMADLPPQEKVSNGYKITELITKINAATNNDEVVALSFQLRTFIDKLINTKEAF